MKSLAPAILRDLGVSPSTADSIAGRLGVHESAIKIILTRLQKTNHITTRPLGPLTIYRLLPPPLKTEN